MELKDILRILNSSQSKQNFSLKFIGTSSGKTHPLRFHSSFIFTTERKNILIDCGDGISRALLVNKIPYDKITDIIITHYHSDHLAGLPSLLTQMIIEKRKTPLKIFTHNKLINLLEKFLTASFLFLDKLDFKVEILGFEFIQNYKIDNQFYFTAKQNDHIVNKHNIQLQDVEFISSSFLFTSGNKKVIYTSDIGSKEDLYLFNEVETDIFITETTHLTLTELENALIIQNPKKIILTHIDLENENKINYWIKSQIGSLKNKIILAQEGIKLEI